jgi:hypothetical protein
MKGINMVKYVSWRHLLFFLESIHKVYFNVLNPWILLELMINNSKFFDFIV